MDINIKSETHIWYSHLDYFNSYLSIHEMIVFLFCIDVDEHQLPRNVYFSKLQMSFRRTVKLNVSGIIQMFWYS